MLLDLEFTNRKTILLMMESMSFPNVWQMVKENFWTEEDCLLLTSLQEDPSLLDLEVTAVLHNSVNMTSKKR